jgi:peroxiredoxin Q/BCP
MGSNKLAVGDQAPDFSATDIDGNLIQLSNYRDKSVLIVFFRYAGCPWCNLAIHRLALEYPMLKRENCEVIAFVQSSSESVQENIYDRHDLRPDFPIIADPEKKFYNLYGVRRSRQAAVRSISVIPQWIHSVNKLGYKQTSIDGDLLLVPAAFLVGARSQKLLQSDYGTSFYKYESFFGIYESLVFNPS